MTEEVTYTGKVPSEPAPMAVEGEDGRAKRPSPLPDRPEVEDENGSNAEQPTTGKKHKKKRAGGGGGQASSSHGQGDVKSLSRGVRTAIKMASEVSSALCRAECLIVPTARTDYKTFVAEYNKLAQGYLMADPDVASHASDGLKVTVLLKGEQCRQRFLEKCRKHLQAQVPSLQVMPYYGVGADLFRLPSNLLHRTLVKLTNKDKDPKQPKAKAKASTDGKASGKGKTKGKDNVVHTTFPNGFERPWAMYAYHAGVPEVIAAGELVSPSSPHEETVMQVTLPSVMKVWGQTLQGPVVAQEYDSLAQHVLAAQSYRWALSVVVEDQVDEPCGLPFNRV